MTKPAHSILVTGASSGIGLATSHKLLDEGYSVIGLSRSIDSVSIDHDHFTALPCDLRDYAQISQCMKPLLHADSTLEGAVFCAGVGEFDKLEQLSFARIEALIELNLLSPIFLSKLVVPFFKARKRGRMVFLGSEAALQGAKNGTAYCASKFGLRGFVQSLAAECRPAGVNVSLINPGMVNTPFFDDLHFMPGEDESNSISPVTIAELIYTTLKVAPNAVIEEINLTPRNKVVSFK